MSDTLTYKSGDVIIEENSSGDEAFYVLSGKVEVHKKVEDGFIILSEFTKGDIFGEMSVIDEAPRSASIVAVEDTQVKVIRREHLINTIQNDKKVSIKFLKRIFERLRDVNLKLAQYTYSDQEADLQQEVQVKSVEDAYLLIEGLTQEAKAALPNNPFQINSFPVTLGRNNDDPFVDNDIPLNDTMPYQLSRSHLRVDLKDKKLSFEDRGSQLGIMVNKKLIGVANNNPLPEEGYDSAEVILGKSNSPFKFSFTLKYY